MFDFNYCRMMTKEILRGFNNTMKLVREDRVFGLLGVVGAATSNAAIPVSLAANIPIIGSLTGHMLVRSPFHPYIINVRSSYIDEAAALIHHFVDVVGMTRISVVYQDDMYGLACLEAIETAISYRRLPIYSRGVFSSVEENVEDAVESIVSTEVKDLGDPQVIIIAAGYNSSAKLIKIARSKWPDMQFGTFSLVGSDALYDMLEPDLRKGILVSQVVPVPTNLNRPFVRQYHLSLHEAHPNSPPSFLSLEGFVVARLAIMAVERITRSVTRDNMVGAIYESEIFRMGRINVGPFRGACDEPGCNCNQGMHQVFVTEMVDMNHTSGYTWPSKFRVIEGESGIFSFAGCGFIDTHVIPGCTVDHWNYTVSECNPKTQHREVTFSWHVPDPFNPSRSLMCDEAIGDNIPITEFLSCEFVLFDSTVGIATIVICIMSIIILLAMIWGVLRKKTTKLMMNSQYKFLIFMMCGGISSLISLILELGHPTSLSCVISPIFLSIGLCALLSALFVRTGRIMRIFDNPTLKKVKVTEKETVMALLLLMLLNIVIVVLWIIVDKPHADTSSTEIHHFGSAPFHTCSSENSVVAPVLIFYKLFLLFGSCYFAYRGRNAPQEFLEAKYFLLAAYNIMVVALVVLPLTLLVELDAATLLIFHTIGLLIAVCGSCGLIVLPKLLLIVQSKDKYSNTSGDSTDGQKKIVAKNHPMAVKTKKPNANPAQSISVVHPHNSTGQLINRSMSSDSNAGSDTAQNKTQTKVSNISG